MCDDSANWNPEPEATAPSLRGAKIGRHSRMRWTSVGLLLGGFALLGLAMHLPQELAELGHNRERIRALQIENNNLRQRRDERRERLRNLKENFNEQELEIQRNFHLYKPGDTIFILPPKNAAPRDAQIAPTEPSGN